MMTMMMSIITTINDHDDDDAYDNERWLLLLQNTTGGVYCLHLSKLASPCPSVFSCSNDWTVVQWATNEAASTRSEGGLFLKQFRF
jgi:hypothetical protein